MLVEAAPAAAAGVGTNPDEGSGSRIKFRSGPVCMCSGGLSEKDIRKGQQRQLHSPNLSRAGSQGIEKQASDNPQDEEE